MPEAMHTLRAPEGGVVLAKSDGFVSRIDAAVDAVIAANPDQVAEYRGGKDKLFGFFVGGVMKVMAGKGNPGLVNAALKAKLG